MEFADYAPMAAPSLEQQRDALRKGLGRAMQWAKMGHLHDAPFVEACLQDLRFDMDVEDTRGAWLWDIIQAVNANARFRETILATLRNMPEDRDACQFCELGFHYAVSGDETFRARLYEIVVQRPFADRPWLGEKQILDLDGEEGFLFAARLRGTQLTDRHSLIGMIEASSM